MAAVSRHLLRVFLEEGVRRQPQMPGNARHVAVIQPDKSLAAAAVAAALTAKTLVRQTLSPSRLKFVRFVKMLTSLFMTTQQLDDSAAIGNEI